MTANSPPFTRVGVDYFSPLTVTKFRRQEKRYGCLFTYLATRAVHLEVVHSLDTDSFVMHLAAGRRALGSDPPSAPLNTSLFR